MATLSPEQRVLATAAAEIGYSRWTDPKRGTKYARETQPALWPRDTWLLANGISYCDIFVTWVFWKAGLLHILPAGASYNTDYRASKGGRIPKSQARPGDVLVFDWNWSTKSTNHVGIFEKNTRYGNPQTIEGNTSPGARGSQSNGGGVYRKPRSGSIKGYVRIDYDAGGSITPTSPDWAPGVDTPKGDINSAGQLVVDGNFNAATSQVLATYFGFQGTGSTTSADYWRQIEVVAKFPVRWQNGKLDVETVKFLQWATKQSINGVWNARFIAGMQTFLNEFSAGREPAYNTWAGG